MKKKTLTLPLGTIVDRTIQPEPRLRGLLDALSTVRLTRDERQRVDRIARALDDIEPCSECALDGCHSCDGISLVLPWTNDGRPEPRSLLDALEEVVEIAEACIPAWTYLGAHEGDGADFGVWPSPELFEQSRGRYGQGDVASSRASAQRGDVYALEVSDHGNPTLYEKSDRRGRWLVAWSIV